MQFKYLLACIFWVPHFATSLKITLIAIRLKANNNAFAYLMFALSFTPLWPYWLTHIAFALFFIISHVRYYQVIDCNKMLTKTNGKKVSNIIRPSKMGKYSEIGCIKKIGLKLKCINLQVISIRERSNFQRYELQDRHRSLLLLLLSVW